MLLGFFVAGLLDVGAIRKEIEGRPLGAKRTIQLALLEPMVALSEAVRFDKPAVALDSMLGRSAGQHHRLADVTPEVKPKWPRTITVEQPLRIVIFGDSMAQSLGPSLKNLSEDRRLIKAKLDYKVSSGLSRPDFFDWPQRMVDQLVELDPDATVIIFGANDAQDFHYEGRVVHVGSQAWRRAYQERVGKAMDILTRNSRRVYWIGNPIMKDAAFGEWMEMINGLYEAEAKQHPGVSYVSTWDLLANKQGRYADYLRDADDDLSLMRGSDGIHLTRAGGDLVAARILDVIAQDWSIVSADDGK